MCQSLWDSWDVIVLKNSFAEDVSWEYDLCEIPQHECKFVAVPQQNPPNQVNFVTDNLYLFDNRC
jgi:hypothetical protein